MKQPLNLPVRVHVDEDGRTHHLHDCPDCGHIMRAGEGRVYYQCPHCAPHHEYQCPSCETDLKSTDGTLRCTKCRANLLVEDGVPKLL